MTQRETPTAGTLEANSPPQEGVSTGLTTAGRQTGLPPPVVVVKRNGMLVPFARERIVRAIELAFRDTKRLPREGAIPADIRQIVDHIAYLVVQELANQAQHGMALTVEGIQDIVEIKLMQAGHLDVARDYIIYRSQHKAEREGSAQALKIQRREGEPPVRFNPIKIAAAIERAFRSAHTAEGPSSPEVVEAVNQLTAAIVDSCKQIHTEGQTISTLLVRELIERQLMEGGYYEVAKGYILSHSQVAVGSHDQVQESVHPASALTSERKPYRAVGAQGEFFFDESFVRAKIIHAAIGLPAIEIEEMVSQTVANFYDGMREDEVDQAYLMAARSRIEWDPDYSKFASRLLLDTLYRDLLGVPAHDPSLQTRMRSYFKSYLQHGVEIKRLDARLLSFDLDRLAEALMVERDGLFGYMGVQTLFDRYFIHENQRRLEIPQIFWMRVAMGLSYNEGELKTDRAIEFYNVISTFCYCPATPTLFNSGTVHSQLSSCYLSTIQDDLAHIFKVIADDAQLSKWAGGIGNDWTPVRAIGAAIKGTNGTSQGIIPFLKVANDTAVAVNQCFAPETLVYTKEGAKPISELTTADLVLGVSGTYRSVLDTMTYGQKDAMVTLKVQHGLEPLQVTAGHPFYAIRGIPQRQSISRTMSAVQKGTARCEWVEAADLKAGDLLAQIVPQETVDVADFTLEDAYMYGVLLGSGEVSSNGLQWVISVYSQQEEQLAFVRRYLTERGISFSHTQQDTSSVQIQWTTSHGAVRDGTTGQMSVTGSSSLPFSSEDLYNAQREKQIAPRLAHLPAPKAWAMVQGLVKSSDHGLHGQAIMFRSPSRALAEGLRYQMLRMGVPTAGHKKMGQQLQGTRRAKAMAGKPVTSTCYEIHVPAVPELARRLGCDPITKQNWLTLGGMVFTRVKSVECQEPVPFVCDLIVEGDESYMTTAGLAHNGGKRKGAMCAYLETWHLDVEDFLELRKNTGDERRRTHDMNTANWIPDLFMQRVLEGGTWTLFSPSDVPDLHDLVGKAFQERYEAYERMTETGEIKLFKKVEALGLWRKMLSMLFETGHPWMTFKDPSNLRSPQQHAGVVHSSNLCTEILLNTSADETAVCNLGSINLALHTTAEGLDQKKLESTVRTAIRMLDNVIDINFYPTKEAEASNQRHRPIGLGLMGFQDALYIQRIPYASPQAVDFADQSMEMISFFALLASSELARERGSYESYKGSLWDQGILPIDSIEILAQHRGEESVQMDRSSTLPWDVVRKSIQAHGMRNSNCMAIAPTATISNIIGVSQSIEPTYKNLYVKSNLSGEFTIPNSYLVSELKALGLWDADMIDDLKYFDGSLLEIPRIPDALKELFLTAFEIQPDWLIECGSRRQKWLDMGQSLNLYMAEPSGKKLSDMYLYAWRKGLKTTYYLRTLAATQIEKSTTDINKRGLQPRWMKNKSASANVQVQRDTPACTLGEACESCQ